MMNLFFLLTSSAVVANEGATTNAQTSIIQNVSPIGGTVCPDECPVWSSYRQKCLKIIGGFPRSCSDKDCNGVPYNPEIQACSLRRQVVQVPETITVSSTGGANTAYPNLSGNYTRELGGEYVWKKEASASSSQEAQEDLIIWLYKDAPLWCVGRTTRKTCDVRSVLPSDVEYPRLPTENYRWKFWNPTINMWGDDSTLALTPVGKENDRIAYKMQSKEDDSWSCPRNSTFIYSMVDCEDAVRTLRILDHSITPEASIEWVEDSNNRPIGCYYNPADGGVFLNRRKDGEDDRSSTDKRQVICRTEDKCRVEEFKKAIGDTAGAEASLTDSDGEPTCEPDVDNSCSVRCGAGYVKQQGTFSCDYSTGHVNTNGFACTQIVYLKPKDLNTPEGSNQEYAASYTREAAEMQPKIHYYYGDESLAKKLALWGIIVTAAVGTGVAFCYLFFLATKNPQSANLEDKRQEGRKSDKPSDEEKSKKEAAEDIKNRNKPREKFTFECIVDKVSTGNSDILECDENVYKMYLIVGGTILTALLIFCFLCRYFCLRKRTASGATE